MFVIVGAGAIGSVVGATLHRGGAVVRLVGRAAHVDAINRHGLALQGDALAGRYPLAATTDLGTLQPDAVICLCMKSFDTAAFLDDAAEVLAGRTLVCFQNGFESEVEVQTREMDCISVVARLPVRMTAPGVVAVSAPGHMTVGRWPTGLVPACSDLVATLRRGGMTADTSADIEMDKWTKLAGNVVGAFLAVTDRTVLDAYADPDAHTFIADLIEETRAVLHAAGKRFTPHDVTIAPTSVPEQRTSVWQDLDRRRGRTEVDGRNGLIARLGRQVGVATPLNDVLTAVCRDMAARQLPPGGHTAASLRAKMPRS